MRCLSLLLAAAAGLSAQVDVLYEQAGVFIPMPANCQLGAVDAGGVLDTRVRLLHRGAGTITIPAVELAGSGFSLPDLTLPATLGPDAAITFTVRLTASGEGTYSASFAVAGFTAILRATVRPAVTVSVEENGVRTPLSTASSYDFGTVEAGIPAWRTFWLENRTTLPLTVAEIRGTVGLEALPVLPAVLGPGAAVSFRVAALPVYPGPWSASLYIGSRGYALRATAISPRLGEPKFLLPEGAVASGRQLPVAIEFAEAPAAPGGGVLTVEYFADYANVDDPAVRFPTGRNIAFTVPAGEKRAFFNGEPQTILQTGTVSGRLVLRVQGSELNVTREIRTLPQGIVIDDAQVIRENNTFLLTLTGFDNTRSNASLSFRFYDRSGAPLSAPLLVEPGALWRDFYTTSTLGGVFRVRAVFPVAGDGSLVASVSVELANAIARTDLGRLPIP